MVVEVVSMLLLSFFEASAPILPVQGADSKPIVIFVDSVATGWIYYVDGAPVSLPNILGTLESKWDRNKKPDQQRKIVIVMHEDLTFARADDLRRIALTAGPEPARVFYFDKDRRLMFEVTYSNAMAFSPKGPGVKARLEPSHRRRP